MSDMDSSIIKSEQRFGYSLERRLKELAASKNNPPLGHDRIMVKGQLQNLEIVRVPIGLPKYRLSNGRTASLQEEWLANNPEQARDFFEKDPELWAAQEEQHRLLRELIKQEGLLDLFKDTSNIQVNPITLDEHGFVINGNRRLCCWRELYQHSPDEYPHFSHVDVVVLPHCDEKEIDRIEADFQIKRDIRANYSWETRAIMMRQKQRLHGIDDKEIADIYGIRKADVEEARDMLALAAEYLKSRGHENQWSRVGDEFAYRELRKAQQRLPVAGDKELLKRSAFALLDDPGSAGDRLYTVIQRTQEHLDAIKTKLAKAFPVETHDADPVIEELFGGAAPTAKPDPAISLAAAIMKQGNAAKAREIIVDTIAIEEELKREKKKEDHLLDLVTAANTKLQTVISGGLRPESSVDGVAAQLDQIDQKVVQIRAWLAKRDA